MLPLEIIVPTKCCQHCCSGKATRFAPYIGAYGIIGWCGKHAPRVWITREELVNSIMVDQVMKS